MNFSKRVKIGHFTVSKNSETFIIAEAGVNHNGDINIARKLIDVAAEAKADAVKFQIFKTEHLILKGTKKALYQLVTTNSKESQFDMLKKLELSKKQFTELHRYCKKKNIIFLITPFDEHSLGELDEFALSAYKVASTDITNIPFLKKIAKKQKPIFLSTGMAYFSEVEVALKAIHPFNKDVVLLQCSANYPIRDEEANLRVINTYKEKFNILVGHSDHSVGVGVAPYAVAMGAKVVEKHFTLNKGLQGPDHKASLNPEELKRFVSEIKKIEKYLGSGVKVPTLSELKTRKLLQKYLITAKGIKKGEKFSEDNLIAKRTGGLGVSPIFYSSIIGKVASKKYKKDEIIEI